jgi:hypothetical protein
MGARGDLNIGRTAAHECLECCRGKQVVAGNRGLTPTSGARQLKATAGGLSGSGETEGRPGGIYALELKLARVVCEVGLHCIDGI